MPLYDEIEKGVVKQCKKALKSELPSDRVMAVFINPFTGSSPPLINILWKQSFLQIRSPARLWGFLD